MSEVEQLRAQLKLMEEKLAKFMEDKEVSDDAKTQSLSASNTQKDESETVGGGSEVSINDSKKIEAMAKAEERRKQTNALDLLKINQACDLRVTDILKLKSDKPSDVLSYKEEIVNYLRSVGVLFAIDENVIEAGNPFLMIEGEVKGKVLKFLLDTWPETLRKRYRKVSQNDPATLWKLLMEDSFKVDPKKISNAKREFENMKYGLGRKPEDFIGHGEISLYQYQV